MRFKRGLQRVQYGLVNEILLQFVQWVSYPVRLYYDLLPDRQRAKDMTPVLLVHGWGCASHSLSIVHLRLWFKGWRNIYSMSYFPPLAGIEHLAGQLAARVDQVLQVTQQPKIFIVAHSMGGLLTRYMMKHVDKTGRVAKIVTLGTPHYGTRATRCVPLPGNVRQMAYESPFIMALGKDTDTPGDVPYLSIYADMDHIVLPTQSSVLKGNAQNVCVRNHGHLALIYSGMVSTMIDQFLRGKKFYSRPSVGESHPSS